MKGYNVLCGNLSNMYMQIYYKASVPESANIDLLAENQEYAERSAVAEVLLLEQKEAHVNSCRFWNHSFV